jgi:serine/threonine protein kinase
MKNLKLCDFGLASRWSADRQATMTAGVGTPAYMAPELATTMGMKGTNESNNNGSPKKKKKKQKKQQQQQQQKKNNGDADPIASAFETNIDHLHYDGEKVDVFSFGVLCWAMWSGEQPYSRHVQKVCSHYIHTHIFTFPCIFTCTSTFMNSHSHHIHNHTCTYYYYYCYYYHHYYYHHYYYYR